jgi:hypothetical protein
MTRNFPRGDDVRHCVYLAHCAAERPFLLLDTVELSRVLMRYSAAFDSAKSRVPRDVSLSIADIRDDLKHAHSCAKDAFIEIRQRDLRHA